MSQSISTYLAPCQAARHHIAMLSPDWSQTIGFAGASEPLPNVVCPRRASRFGPSHREYADDCRAGDVIRDPLRQVAEFAVVFRRDEPAHRASGVDAAPRVYGCRFLSSATRQSSHRAEGARRRRWFRATVPMSPRTSLHRSRIHPDRLWTRLRGGRPYAAPSIKRSSRPKAAGEQSLAGELSRRATHCAPRRAATRRRPPTPTRPMSSARHCPNLSHILHSYRSGGR